MWPVLRSSAEVLTAFIASDAHSTGGEVPGKTFTATPGFEDHQRGEGALTHAFEIRGAKGRRMVVPYQMWMLQRLERVLTACTASESGRVAIEQLLGQFSGGAGQGSHPLVVSYASSPPAEVIFSETPLDEAPTGVIEAGCFRQIEFAGVLAGSDAPGLAGAFIDFMLSVEFQEDIPLNMFVFPANEAARLPDAFVEHTIIPDTVATLDPALIDANRQRWIEEWDTVMLP